MAEHCTQHNVIVKDRGYAWLVLVACAVLNYLCIGFLFGIIGVLTSEYKNLFQDVGIDDVTWVGSILFAVLFLSGPAAAFFIGKLGVRKVAVIASVAHAIAFAVSAFATELWHVILSFAVICGIACCACHVCTMKILTVYFDKYQHMAYAVRAIGSDLAAVSFPFITTLILGQFTYKYSILIISAALLLAIPCAISFSVPSDNGGSDPSVSMAMVSPLTSSFSNNIGLAFLCHTIGSLIIGRLPVLLGAENEVLNRPHSADNEEGMPDQAIASTPLVNGEATTNNTDTAEANDKLGSDTNNEVESHGLQDHLKVVTTPYLVIFIINSMLWNMGGSVTSVLAYEFYIERGYSYTAASLAMTMYGVGSLIGSLCVAVGTIFFKPNKFVIHCLCNLVMGAGILALPFLVFAEAAMTTCLAMLGFVYGVICANLGGIIEHLNGNKLLYLVYGYEMAAAGVGSFIGPIAAGYLGVRSGVAFYFGGASALLALLIFLFYACYDRSVLRPAAASTSQQEKSGDCDTDSNCNTKLSML